MTVTLSLNQTMNWLQGNWLAYEVEETVLEDLDRQNITSPVAVVDPAGRPLFGITPPRRGRA
jgi:hypothetical protein